MTLNAHMEQTEGAASGREQIEVEATDMPVETSTPPIFTLDSIEGELVADVTMRNEAKTSGRNFGPVTPWPEMTKEYGGAIPAGMHVVMGGSGVGKTAYALQLAACCECPALYVSCEMGRVELFRRLVARTTSTFLGRLKDGDLTAAQARTLAARAAATARQMAIVDATQIPASRAFIQRSAVALRERHSAPFVLVVIDSMHSWAESHAGVTDEREAVAQACREMRTLASVLEGPVMAIAETSRASSNLKPGDDRIGSGAGSRKIEFGSESVLYLETKAEEGFSGERQITARFEKNRHNSKGRRVELKFHGALQRYEEAD